MAESAAANRLREWSDSAAGNNSTNIGGLNFAEGQLPNSLNNSIRELMAQARQWYYPDQAGWVDYAQTASLNSQTVIKVGTTDLTGAFTEGRRVRHRGGSTTRYSTVVSSSFTTETTVTVTVDSGSLSASHTIVGIATTSFNTMPRRVDTLDVSATASVGALTVGGGFRATSGGSLAGDITYESLRPPGLGSAGLMLPAFNSTASASIVMAAMTFSGGFTWVDPVNNKLVIWNGSVWKSVALV